MSRPQFILAAARHSLRVFLIAAALLVLGILSVWGMIALLEQAAGPDVLPVAWRIAALLGLLAISIPSGIAHARDLRADRIRHAHPFKPFNLR